MLIVPASTWAGVQELPKAWIASGSHPQDYKMGIDPDTSHGGKSSGTIKSVSDHPAGFGMLMQTVSADKYRGRRLRLTGYVKSREVEQWSGLWMRVDGKKYLPLAFDNMQDRPVKGTTEWQKVEIVLDVPEKAVSIAFGLMLMGGGQVWVDDIQLKTVSRDVRVTNLLRMPATPPEAARPRSTNFETEGSQR
jgi:hypothetical protein